MPVSYAGTVSEHNATRNAVGLFDVSHLGKALVRGPGAARFVNSALTNDLDRIGPGKAQSGKAQSGKAQSGKAQSGKAQSGKAQSGKAQYTLCCTESGGVIDDLIAYYVD